MNLRYQGYRPQAHAVPALAVPVNHRRGQWHVGSRNTGKALRVGRARDPSNQAAPRTSELALWTVAALSSLWVPIRPRQRPHGWIGVTCGSAQSTRTIRPPGRSCVPISLRVRVIRSAGAVDPDDPTVSLHVRVRYQSSLSCTLCSEDLPVYRKT
jgi:hypothetical protein